MKVNTIFSLFVPFFWSPPTPGGNISLWLLNVSLCSCANRQLGLSAFWCWTGTGVFYCFFHTRRRWWERWECNQNTKLACRKNQNNELKDTKRLRSLWVCHDKLPHTSSDCSYKNMDRSSFKVCWLLCCVSYRLFSFTLNDFTWIIIISCISWACKPLSYVRKHMHTVCIVSEECVSLTLAGVVWRGRLAVFDWGSPHFLSVSQATKHCRCLPASCQDVCRNFVTLCCVQ